MRDSKERASSTIKLTFVIRIIWKSSRTLFAFLPFYFRYQWRKKKAVSNFCTELKRSGLPATKVEELGEIYRSTFVDLTPANWRGYGRRKKEKATE
nr:McmJ [Thermoactinomyces sp.]